MHCMDMRPEFTARFYGQAAAKGAFMMVCSAWILAAFRSNIVLTIGQAVEGWLVTQTVYGSLPQLSEQ